MKQTKPVYKRAFETLLNGKTLTPGIISSRYSVDNPHDVIYKIRNRLGGAVISTPFTTKKGAKSVRYSLPAIL